MAGSRHRLLLDSHLSALICVFKTLFGVSGPQFSLHRVRSHLKNAVTGPSPLAAGALCRFLLDRLVLAGWSGDTGWKGYGTVGFK